jgi:hypothetical protein
MRSDVVLCITWRRALLFGGIATGRFVNGVKAIVRVFCVDGPCAGLQYVDADSGLILFCELAGCRRCFYRINHIAYDAGRRPDAYFDHLESLPSLTASYAGSADDRDALVGAISQPWRCAASTVAAADVERPGPLGAPRWGVSRRSGWPSWSTLGPLVLVSDSPAAGGPSSCPRPAGPAAGGRQAEGRAGQTTWRSACRCVCVATTTAITSSGTPGRGAVAAHHVHPRRPSPGQAR